ncbi:sigma D regulator [Simiduia agarivorans]|uniref:Anti-RNA polymerase sigma 70 factor n=1 Tax=Simiduia agarivorans (strain DSM 21679 / JCM 13881 / BCRC 17597 / SA1) TaxID=1117647 RepID=K4L0R9_SIMAS|nr:sigma D regulator [Simiduia agarivorans]AFU99742.1 anti-RNA polymerase sigma 70 factor [Simiduia agarivorans SA1 = DSM 21679]
MLENCKSAKERWGGVSEIIDRWLQERQDALVLYCKLSEHDEFEPERHGDDVRSLCQLLVDYSSAGHFEVYKQLVAEAKEFDDQDAIAEAAELYSEIDPTTDLILDFNDKYQEIDDLDALRADLSRLGSALETRFSAEDRMIAVLHDAHKDLVS